MDHYIPKRRIPVTVWADHLQGVSGQVFLDLDPTGHSHQTILERLNQSSPFLPIGMGEEGRIHLLHRHRIHRITPGRQVLQGDVFSRGFQPWREERAEIVLCDGTHLQGVVWMPLERETERLSDYLNRLGSDFFVLLSATGVHLLNTQSVVEVELAESAGAPLSIEAA